MAAFFRSNRFRLGLGDVEQIEQQPLKTADVLFEWLVVLPPLEGCTPGGCSKL